MTCIVAVAQGGAVVMGGDSAGVVDGGYAITVRKDPKVFALGELVLGFTTSYRMGQLLRYALKVPPREPGQDAYEWMVAKFVDAARACLREGGFIEKEKERESAGTFMVGMAGRLFTVMSDFQVEESAEEYAAIGCGEYYALGSLYTTPRYSPRERVMIALAAAEKHNAGVRRPFVVAEVAGANTRVLASMGDLTVRALDRCDHCGEVECTAVARGLHVQEG